MKLFILTICLFSVQGFAANWVPVRNPADVLRASNEAWARVNWQCEGYTFENGTRSDFSSDNIRKLVEIFDSTSQVYKDADGSQPFFKFLDIDLEPDISRKTVELYLTTNADKTSLLAAKFVSRYERSQEKNIGTIENPRYVREFVTTYLHESNCKPKAM
jgi:hypothetical protein